ncbi:hypothetical protein LCM27_01850 [Ruegeria marisrubri]|uniref:hypothetical protein n=1 Tax=Ruegeria marisrubri TaxID=1685379 RepID=UPI001CD19BE1|nr:hypothetical protein [Ruegeria marisrubri]MCA0905136.1 hypothetical protein [Ruegeria marisrubri]
MSKKTFIERILLIEPGVSFLQWAYDRVVSNWLLITSLFGGGVMAYTSTFTDWALKLGPAGIAGLTIGTFAILALVLTLIRWISIKARYKDAELMLISKSLSDRTTRINPVEQEFSKERFHVSDIVHPISGVAEGKSLTDCEMYGPGTIVFGGEQTVIYGVKFTEVNIIPIHPGSFVPNRNQYAFVNCTIRGGQIANINILAQPDIYEKFIEGGLVRTASFPSKAQSQGVEPDMVQQGPQNG